MRQWEIWDRISHLGRERVRERVRQWEMWDRISHLGRERERERVGDVGQILTHRVEEEKRMKSSCI